MGMLSTMHEAIEDGLDGVDAPSPRTTNRQELRPKGTFRRIEPLCAWGAREFGATDTTDIRESYIGEWMINSQACKGRDSRWLMDKQGQLQELYEGRIASLERLVGFLVLFHSMAKAVQDFWPMVSFGILGYDMSRSQSIMRVATTASPISGADVRCKTLAINGSTARSWAKGVIRNFRLAARALHGVAVDPRVDQARVELLRQRSTEERRSSTVSEEGSQVRPSQDGSPPSIDLLSEQSLPGFSSGLKAFFRRAHV